MCEAPLHSCARLWPIKFTQLVRMAGDITNRPFECNREASLFSFPFKSASTISLCAADTTETWRPISYPLFTFYLCISSKRHNCTWHTSPHNSLFVCLDGGGFATTDFSHLILSNSKSICLRSVRLFHCKTNFSFTFHLKIAFPSFSFYCQNVHWIFRTDCSSTKNLFSSKCSEKINLRARRIIHGVNHKPYWRGENSLSSPL